MHNEGNITGTEGKVFCSGFLLFVKLILSLEDFLKFARIIIDINIIMYM